MKKIKSIYKFIYVYIYQFYRRKQSIDSSRDYAIGITLLYMFSHLCACYGVIKYAFDIPSFLLRTGLTYGQRKYIGIVILFVVSIPFERYLKKKHDSIINPYLDSNVVTIKNSVLMVSLFVLPLVIVINLQAILSFLFDIIYGVIK